MVIPMEINHFYPRPPSAPTAIVIGQCVRPSIRLSVPNDVTTVTQDFIYRSDIWLRHITMKQIAIENGHMLSQFLHVTWNCYIFWERPGIGLKKDVTAAILSGFKLLAWNVAGWCMIPWSWALSKFGHDWPIFAHFIELFHGRLGPGLREGDSY